MHVSYVAAEGFRNLSGRLEGQPGLNFLWGRNGHGKTGWLEAVYLLGGTKSFRTRLSHELIAFHRRAARLQATVTRRSRSYLLEIHLEDRKKSLFVNHKKVSVGDYLGRLDAFAYCHEEMCVVRGEPSERRRFLDRGVLSLKPGYVRALADYNRTLKQKNALLRAASESAERPAHLLDMLEAWNAQLVEHGTTMHAERLAYVARLNLALEKRLFGAETVTVNYISSLAAHLAAEDGPNYAAALAERLRVRRDAEIAAGHSLVGPHRDDLDIAADGRAVARFGSAGQQRSALLILTLAQLAIYQESHDEYPVFLLDDIDAELDYGRIDALLDYLDGKAQVFLTTSKSSLAEAHRRRAHLHCVANGVVSPPAAVAAPPDGVAAAEGFLPELLSKD
jgi:DNA replication and repair protein RecF